MKSNTNSEGIRIAGVFNLRTFDGTGKLLEDYTDDNLVVNVGKNSLALLIVNDPATQAGEKAITKIGFGTNGTTPAAGNTGLTAPFIKLLSDYTTPTLRSVQFNFLLDLSENNGVTIQEFGLFTDDGGLFARKVRAPIAKTNTVRLEGSWTITFL